MGVEAREEVGARAGVGAREGTRSCTFFPFGFDPAFGGGVEVSFDMPPTFNRIDGRGVAVILAGVVVGGAAGD